MFQEFPDDNKGEEFLNEFRQKIADQSDSNFEERRNELNRSKSVFIGAVSGVVLAGIVGWFVLSPRYHSEQAAELPVIRRPQTAIKVQPADPGGMEILNQDKSVYEIMEKKANSDKPAVENLLPPPEEPKLPVIAAELPTAPVEEEDAVARIIENSATGKPAAVVVEAQEVIRINEAPKAVAATQEKAPDKEVSLSEAMKKTASAETAKPAVSPAPPAPAPKAAAASSIPVGSWQVQLMSSANKPAMEKSWAGLVKKYSSLADQPHEIETADLGAKGTFYRLKAGAFRDRADADTLCNDIKALGGTCIVKKK